MYESQQQWYLVQKERLAVVAQVHRYTIDQDALTVSRGEQQAQGEGGQVVWRQRVEDRGGARRARLQLEDSVSTNSPAQHMPHRKPEAFGWSIYSIPTAAGMRRKERIRPRSTTCSHGARSARSSGLVTRSSRRFSTNYAIALRSAGQVVAIRGHLRSHRCASDAMGE